MGLFEEQVNERKEYDDIALEAAFAKMSDAVTGKKDYSFKFDSSKVTNNAIEEVLRHFHIRDEVQALTDDEDIDERLERVLNPHGIMRRRVALSSGWYKDATGPFLTSLKEDGRIVALIPAHPTGYQYFDNSKGKYVKVSKENEGLFETDAYSFYRPFPLRKMNVVDLFNYIVKLISVEDIGFILFLYLIATLMGCLSPKFTKMLYGTVVNSKSMQLLFAFSVFMIMTMVSMSIVSTLRSFMVNRLNIKISMNIESATLMRILSLPPSFFRGYTSGELSQLTGYIQNLCNQLISLLLMNTLNSLFSLIYLRQIFVYAPSIVVPALAIIIFTTVFNIVCALANMKRSKLIMKKSARMTGVSYSLLSGIEKIKLAGAEKRAFAKWADCYSDYATQAYNPPLFLKVSTVINSAITMTGTIVMYYITIKSGIKLEEYVAFMAAYGMISSAFGGLGGIVKEVANIRPSMEMCKPILEAVPEVTENKEFVSNVKGDLSIDHVTFRYDENSKYIFDDFSLKIKKGEYVAIVGKTGCGKSTLVRLILGFERPESGAIYLDGRDIKSVDIKSVRRNIGTVIQNGKVFQGDIYSNIVVSAPKASLEDAWEAAKIAGIDEEIKQMPMQMNTVISEGQGGISGGQKQRILIARAVAAKPKMLIFDEATSALDNITQKQVADALNGLKCTRIVIAHRLSTIKECDRIIVIDEGKIVEEGTYDELLLNKGYFAKLVARQMVE